jgi:glyoxylase I family protein
MAIDKVLADVAVDDFALALTWYERLLGRPADAAPMDGLAEWQWATSSRRIFDNSELST